MKGLQNDWYPIQSDNPNILKEAGINSVRKREQQCDARERLCDEREDSLDGKPKAKKKKNNIQHHKMKELEDKKGKAEKKDNQRKEQDIVDEEFWNSDPLLSPGQMTVGNDSLIDGFSHATVYSGK